ncbi:MAG: prenyltransferase/squalene oxidase repeat-containing protein [Verrucomicrobiota bacterium]|nr:prenyltransferase/squalene oxidase repeat-containing protein [Verrucomicrobiota bacterium]
MHAPTDNADEWYISQLRANPSDWHLRCLVTQRLYECGDYSKAALLMSEAPDIPGDEESIIFAATILGVETPLTGIAILKGYQAASASSPAIDELQQHLNDLKSGQTTEFPATPETNAVKVMPKPKRLGQTDVVEGDQEPTPEIAPATTPALEITGPYPTDHNDTENEVPDHEGEYFHAAVVEDEAYHGRSFIVGEGEAVQVADRESQAKAKMGSVLVAAIVHVVLILILMFVIVATPPPTPPQITISSLANTEEVTIENQTLVQNTQKTATAAPATQPVITSAAFSNVIVSDNFEMDADLSMISMSDNDVGFGISMSGFGGPSNMGAIPAGMRSRCSLSERMRLLREMGGEDRAERAVRDGLRYLTSQQDRETGAIGKTYTVAMTGLSLLAYLGHCETPESPKFGDAVVKAAMFLIETANDNRGLMTNGKSGHHEAYEHAIATYALSELFTMTKESGREIPRLGSVIKKSAGIIIDYQTGNGGWPYLGRENGKDDLSVSGWNIQALKAAYNTGVGIPGIERALDGATEDYLPATQDEKGAFKYNISQPEGRQSLTAAALLGMQIWKGYKSDSYNKGYNWLKGRLKNPGLTGGSHGLYEPYYNTQVFFMEGGKDWEAYNSIFQPRLLDAQNEDGSWMGDGNREDYRIMNTSWAILMLEVYYRYLPTTDKIDMIKGE